MEPILPGEISGIMQTVASDLVVSDPAVEICHNWGWDPEVGIGRRSHLVKTGLENFPKSPTPGHQRWEPRISFHHIFVLCIGPNSIQEQLQSVGKGNGIGPGGKEPDRKFWQPCVPIALSQGRGQLQYTFISLYPVLLSVSLMSTEVGPEKLVKERWPRDPAEPDRKGWYTGWQAFRCLWCREVPSQCLVGGSAFWSSLALLQSAHTRPHQDLRRKPLCSCISMYGKPEQRKPTAAWKSNNEEWESKSNSIEPALLRTSRAQLTCWKQFLYGVLTWENHRRSLQSLEAPTWVLTGGHQLLTLLTWRGLCGSTRLSGFSAREECPLGLALKMLAGKVSRQLSQASSPAYWCQPQREGQKDRGHAGQLVDIQRIHGDFCTCPFNSILKKKKNLFSRWYPRGTWEIFWPSAQCCEIVHLLNHILFRWKAVDSLVW